MAFPGTYNFSYYKGDTNEFVIRPKNSDGSVFDLTGYTAEFWIAKTRGANPTPPAVEAQATTSSSTVTCIILPSVGSTLASGTYVYDVEITSGPNTVYTLLTGTITVTDQVSGA